MTQNQKDAILLLADYINFKIEKDNTNYAGGAPGKVEFLKNIEYSNTNNVYGVYDLICAENELTYESNADDKGRFRLIIK